MRFTKTKPRKPAPNSKSYYDTPPAKRQTMSVKDKIKDLDYKPGVFAYEILDTKITVFRGKARDNWSHK